MADFKIHEKPNNANPLGSSLFLLDNGTDYENISIDQLKVIVGSALEAIAIKNLYESNDNTNAFTDAYKALLDNPDKSFKGYYLTSGALTTAHPSAQPGEWAAVYNSTSLVYQVWIWNTDVNPDAWTNTGETANTSGMQAAIYDPQNKKADAFVRANHTGTQLASTISDLQAAITGNTSVAASAAFRELFNLAGIANNQILRYNQATAKFIPYTLPNFGNLHAQNTDLGTSNPTFYIGSSNTLFRFSSGVPQYSNNGGVSWLNMGDGANQLIFPNMVLSGLKYTQNGYDIIFQPFLRWYINGAIYELPIQKTLTFNPVASGFYRIDIVVADTNNNLYIVQGTPDVSENPIKPAAPANTVEVTFAIIRADETPVIGTPSDLNSEPFNVTGLTTLDWLKGINNFDTTATGTKTFSILNPIAGIVLTLRTTGLTAVNITGAEKRGTGVHKPGGENIYYIHPFKTDTPQVIRYTIVNDLPSSSGSGDMTKAVYDNDNDGKVDAAEVTDDVNGIDAAAASTYYGKNGAGQKGFHNLPTSSTATGMFAPVADLAALKAIDTTSGTNYPDRWLIHAETLGIYALDRESTATGDDNLVVTPTTGAGRWIKKTHLTVTTETATFQPVTWTATTTTIIIPANIKSHKFIIDIPSGTAISSSTLAVSGSTNGLFCSGTIRNSSGSDKTINLPATHRKGKGLLSAIVLPHTGKLDISFKDDGSNVIWQYTETEVI